MELVYTIRGEDGIVQQGAWKEPLPKRGARLSALPFSLPGELLFLGTDHPKDDAAKAYVRLLLVAEKIRLPSRPVAFMPSSLPVRQSR